MTRPTIFLDFDGVIASYIPGASAMERLHPERVRKLDELVRRTHAQVVVSSTWRECGVPQLLAWLRACGYTATIDGVTPMHGPLYENIEATRGAEIFAWRRANRARGPYAVLDDLALRGRIARRLVRVETGGLEHQHIEQAAELLAA